MSVRRVRIHADRGGDPVSVDVVLPSRTPVVELLPAIVDLVDGRSPSDAAARRWRLERPAGGIVDELMSLQDNVVHDGDLLTLSHVDAPALGTIRVEPAHAAVATPLPGHGLGLALPGACCLGAAVLASIALALAAGTEQALTNAIVAAVGACAAAGVAVATGYGTPSILAFVCLAAAAGFLAVPSAPGAPNVFLAAMAGSCASLSMLRSSGRVSSTLIAIAALSLPLALTTLPAVPVGAIGAMLSSAGLVLLALAPRLSVLAAGPSGGEVTGRAATAHAILSGLVAGGATGGSLGVVLVVSGHASNTRGALALSALVAAVLLLRARTYVDAVRRVALVTNGLVSVAAGLWLLVATQPEFVGAVGGVLVAGALLVVAGVRPPASAARLFDRFEYVALAAVAPVASWVGGVYALVGGTYP